jgi:hypothetical protein
MYAEGARESKVGLSPKKTSSIGRDSAGPHEYENEHVKTEEDLEEEDPTELIFSTQWKKRK